MAMETIQTTLPNPPAAAAEVDIEWLLTWAYRVQLADGAEARGAGARASPGWAADSVVRVARALALGTVRISGTGGGGPAAEAISPDAELVHQAVRGLPWPRSAVVIQHARLGTRPECFLGVEPRVVPVISPRTGRPRIKYEPWDRSWNYGHCLFVFEPVEPVEVIAARELYVAWWDALELLALALRVGGGLSRFRVGPRPAAPRSPWGSGGGVDVTGKP